MSDKVYVRGQNKTRHKEAHPTIVKDSVPQEDRTPWTCPRQAEPRVGKPRLVEPRG